jgi:hypothetical protein
MLPFTLHPDGLFFIGLSTPKSRLGLQGCGEGRGAYSNLHQPLNSASHQIARYWLVVCAQSKTMFAPRIPRSRDDLSQFCGPGVR